jgi:cation:H+ antiporter
VANLLGSNLFNVLVLAVDDVFYRSGPLLSQVNPVHGISAFSAIMMSGLAIIGLFYRPTGRVLHSVGWVSVFLFVIYMLNSYILYLADL